MSGCTAGTVRAWVVYITRLHPVRVHEPFRD